MTTRAEICFRYGLTERLSGSQEELYCMGSIYPNHFIHSPVSMTKTSMDKLVSRKCNRLLLAWREAVLRSFARMWTHPVVFTPVTVGKVEGGKLAEAGALARDRGKSRQCITWIIVARMLKSVRVGSRWTAVSGFFPRKKFPNIMVLRTL